MNLTPVSQIPLSDGTIHVLYELQPRQMECYNLTPLIDPSPNYPRNIGYGGAAGGGKSHLARAVACSVALAWPGSRTIIFRLTEDEVIDNHVSYFQEEVPEVLPDGSRLYKYRQDRMIATFENKSLIYFGYLKDFKDVKQYQGNAYDCMIFEEATHYNFEEVRWLVGNRLRANTKESRPFAVYPSNPGNRGHYWYRRLFIDRDYDPEFGEFESDYVFVQAKVADNVILCERDPRYIKQLNTMPEPHRSWMRDGNWDAGLGLAIPQLDRKRHLVKPFKVPEHWPMWGSFDWGYAHPFSFGVYAMNEDRRVYKLDTITGIRLQPNDIAAKVDVRLAEIGLTMKRLRYVVAGHDTWADVKARDENIPTIAERLQGWGWRLRQANISRISGLNNLRLFLQWENVFPDGTDDAPYLMLMDTPGNRKCYRCLATLPEDPDNPEDAAKRDADSFGLGGDDEYDETRYAVASRQMPARSKFLADEETGAFSQHAIRLEYERQRRGHAPKLPTDEPMQHPEFGAVY